MFDCHVHTGISPVHLDAGATKADRDRFANWLRERGELYGIDRFCGIVQILGGDVETCRAHNELMAAMVREHSDILHGWARVNPEWGDDAVTEFRRAVTEDGLLGLKLTAEVKCDDPRVRPLAEAAIEMDVPVKIHTMQRVERREELPEESFSDDVRRLAEAYPDLKLLASHISGGGDWEYRLKNVAHLDNVYMDLSGSVSDEGVVAAAADHLGVDRLVFGTDNSMHASVGRLEGCDLTPEQRAEVAYRMADLLRDDDPYGYDDETLDRLKREAVERFERHDEDRDDDRGAPIVDANAFVGRWPFRRFDGSADALVDLLDEKGVDRAVVSSVGSAWYKNAQSGNEELAEAVAGREDRLLPLATINPTYAAWESDLDRCLDEFGMRGVKLLPNHHDYDLDDPAAVDLAARCADRGVPVFLVPTLVDQRQRHPRVQLRGFEGFRGKPKRWRDEQVDALVALLNESPRTDFVVADAWQSAYRIKSETLHERRAAVDDPDDAGRLLFVLGDLFFDYPGQREKVVAELGADHLACGPQLPFKVFESYHLERYLDVDDAARERIRSGNVLDLLE